MHPNGPPESYGPGEHFIRWDTKMQAAGPYFVRLRTASGSVAVQRWMRLR